MAWPTAPFIYATYVTDDGIEITAVWARDDDAYYAISIWETQILVSEDAGHFTNVIEFQPQEPVPQSIRDGKLEGLRLHFRDETAKAKWETFILGRRSDV